MDTVHHTETRKKDRNVQQVAACVLLTLLWGLGAVLLIKALGLLLLAAASV